MATVGLNEVVKVYDNGVLAVQDFNLQIEDKEFIILVGPSGCGKSTVLRMIAGLESITEGEISIDGKVVNNVSAKDRDIAMVFQNYALYPHMTVYDNIAFALKMRKVPKDEIDNRVRHAAETLQLTELLDRKPKQLSGGQRQRVALGRAIVREPKVFLMDEPLSNLDAKLRVEMRVQITKLYQQLQTTIIYVTHDQTEAMTMGTRIVVMKDGIVQQVATPTDLYNLPVNLFVARFIGMPPMNTIEGRLGKDEAGLFVCAEPIGTDSKEQSTHAVDSVKLYLLPRYETEEVLAPLDRPVILGIRPEHIYMEPEDVERYSDTKLQVKAEVVEMLGAESYLYLKTQWDSNLTARINDQVHDVRYDDMITVALDPDHIHLFDYETEVSIIH